MSKNFVYGEIRQDYELFRKRVEVDAMKKLRWGLIGCGDISRKRVAHALRDAPQCERIAVSRASGGQAEAYANEFSSKRWPGHWRELIADDEIAAVYIATPVYLHAEQ